MKDEVTYCQMPLCEWEAVFDVDRVDGSQLHLCAQCHDAYQSGFAEGASVENQVQATLPATQEPVLDEVKDKLVVRNADGTTTDLFDWLQSDAARQFLGRPGGEIDEQVIEFNQEMLTVSVVGLICGVLLGFFLVWLFFSVRFF